MVGLKDSNDESSCDVEYHILPVDISHITQTDLMKLTRNSVHHLTLKVVVCSLYVMMPGILPFNVKVIS